MNDTPGERALRDGDDNDHRGEANVRRRMRGGDTDNHRGD